MKIKIKNLPEKKLVAIRLKMNLAKNQTFELWNQFMKKRNEISNIVSSDLFSVQEYDFKDFSEFTPHTLFTKWAAIEVSDFSSLPEGMETYILPEGAYAVFIYKGLPQDSASFFQNIFMNLIPQSEYEVDNTRPHFELLGKKYKNNHPDSEEEVWIPVK